MHDIAQTLMFDRTCYFPCFCSASITWKADQEIHRMLILTFVKFTISSSHSWLKWCRKISERSFSEYSRTTNFIVTWMELKRKFKPIFRPSTAKARHVLWHNPKPFSKRHPDLSSSTKRKESTCKDAQETMVWHTYGSVSIKSCYSLCLSSRCTENNLCPSTWNSAI